MHAALTLVQEREHLRLMVSRLTAMQPDVVVVQKTVARIAQQLLLEAGVTVVVGVSASMLDPLHPLDPASSVVQR